MIMTKRVNYDGVEFLSSLEAECSQRLDGLLKDCGLHYEDKRQKLAESFASSLTEHMARTWAGQQIYILSRHMEKLRQRNASIYADFNGFNHGELAEKYQMGIHSIYSILKKESEARRLKQGWLLNQ